MDILHRYTKEVIYSSNKETIKEAVIEAVAAKANLSKANLSGVNLAWMDLSGMDLSGADLFGARIKTTQKDSLLEALHIKFED